jgi:hypothetical protein
MLGAPEFDPFENKRVSYIWHYDALQILFKEEEVYSMGLFFTFGQVPPAFLCFDDFTLSSTSAVEEVGAFMQKQGISFTSVERPYRELKSEGGVTIRDGTKSKTASWRIYCIRLAP